MESISTFEQDASIQNKMDEEKKKLMYKIIFNVGSVAAVIGIPYLFYIAAVHLF